MTDYKVPTLDLTLHVADHTGETVIPVVAETIRRAVAERDALRAALRQAKEALEATDPYDLPIDDDSGHYWPVEEHAIDTIRIALAAIRGVLREGE